MPDLKNAIAAWLDSRDEAAAASLIEELYPQVVACARRHLPFRMDAEDLAQEIFVKLFASLPRYKPALPLANWVSRLALNVCRDHLRRRACRPELRWSDLSEGEQQAFAAAQESIETPVTDTHAARELLAKLLETIPADDRLVLTLLYVEGHSIAETAALTGWSRVGLKVRAFRARARLRQALQALDDAGEDIPSSFRPPPIDHP